MNLNKYHLKLENIFFSYADIDKGGEFEQFFNPKSSLINMKLIILDFKYSRYYIHNKE